eukprot:TRINITY_DN8077_c0_g1_i1.p1 TRINITY_DN8077_c0_g1~~TRINITY_DN8077_c0_g1_i1.p1  ORF type:complete len:375 (-),score=72.11 TRINITY_DN8077_c0_g1_i1:17-1141(-)
MTNLIDHSFYLADLMESTLQASVQCKLNESLQVLFRDALTCKILNSRCDLENDVLSIEGTFLISPETFHTRISNGVISLLSNETCSALATELVQNLDRTRPIARTFRQISCTDFNVTFYRPATATCELLVQAATTYLSDAFLSVQATIFQAHDSNPRSPLCQSRTSFVIERHVAATAVSESGVQTEHFENIDQSTQTTSPQFKDVEVEVKPVLVTTREAEVQTEPVTTEKIVPSPSPQKQHLDGKNEEEQIDEMVGSFVKQIPGADHIKKIKPGVFQIGSKKLNFQIRDGYLVVRVGGGFITFDEWLQKYGRKEGIPVDVKLHEGIGYNVLSGMEMKTRKYELHRSSSLPSTISASHLSGRTSRQSSSRLDATN